MCPCAGEGHSRNHSWRSLAASIVRSGDSERMPRKQISRESSDVSIDGGVVKRSNSDQPHKTLEHWVAAVTSFLKGDAAEAAIAASSLSTAERNSDASPATLPLQQQQQQQQRQQQQPPQADSREHVQSPCSPPVQRLQQQSIHHITGANSWPCLSSTSCSGAEAPTSAPVTSSTVFPNLPRISATRLPYSDSSATASSRFGRCQTARASQPCSSGWPSMDSSSDDETEEVTRQLTAAFPSFKPRASYERRSWAMYSRLQPQGVSASEPTTPRLLSQRSTDTGSEDLTVEEAHLLEQRRKRRNNSHLTTGDAAVELFLRLNHAKQTLEFSGRQAILLSSTPRAHMTVWEALDHLDELREYEAALRSEAGAPHLDPNMSLKEHAFQTAELCRMAHPDLDWLHLVGLLHGLGKLMAHPMFGSQPQWAICGESFPVGCRFDPRIEGSQFFSANADRRRRLFTARPTGMYSPGCGLVNVAMSWSAAEMLYLTLLLNDTALPQEALFIIRHQKFYSITRPGFQTSPYHELLCPGDHSLLPLLASFQHLATYRRVDLPAESTLAGKDRQAYYDGLLEKYGLDRQLTW